VVILSKRERIDQLVAAHATARSELGSGSLLRQTLRRLRGSYMGISGGIIIAVFVLLAVLGPWIAPYDPADQRWGHEVFLNRNIFPGPRAENWLGVDRLGRDQLSRLLVGARQTLLVGVVATLMGFTLGAIIGGFAGAAVGLLGRVGARIDAVIMRVVDMMLAIPTLLLALTIAALLGPSLTTVMIAVGGAQVPIFARLLRGSMLAQAHSDYVLAARSVGVPTRRIVLAHVFPNSLGPVLVQSTLTLATAIIDAAALSYLGLGNPDRGTPEWGTMLAQSQEFLLDSPGMSLAPALAIIVTALGFTLLGEALRESLDPRLRRQ
jgi:peptide/nickel transport system permease protein